ncbi:MAG: hypothetical protein JWP87_4709 [Labilithrix sp.]|nr:hypothetical protein [Labilithrix sp.]
MGAMTHESLLLDARRANARTTTIAEVMTTSPHTITIDQRLSRANEVMRQYGLRHLPVLAGTKLVGVISRRDLYVIEAIGVVDAGCDEVAQAMGAEFYAVAPGDCVGDVARVMGQHSYGCAVVVDRGHVVGIFTATDALSLLARAIS